MDISLEITKLIKDTLKKINIEDANFIVEIPNNKTMVIILLMLQWN